MQPPHYPAVDFVALAQKEGVDLMAAFTDLRALYDEVDARNAANTAGLNLPCHRGCDMCCHESVFVTPLEFFYMWHWAQANLPADLRDDIIRRGLALYASFADAIGALDAPPPAGAADHLQIARQIRFTCPLLSASGDCTVYPVRELLARLFGCSFNDASGVYGCHLVAAHLAGKTVRLLPARATARRLSDLPLTFKRQVYPYYFNLLFGDPMPPTVGGR